MRLKDKLKRSLQSSNIKIPNRTLDKLKSSLINNSSFKTPETLSEIEKFNEKISDNSTSNLLKGGGSFNEALKNAGDNLLKDVTNNVKKKIKKTFGGGGILNNIKGSSRNTHNNPLYKSWKNDYVNKVEGLTSFVTAGTPFIKFEVYDVPGLATEEYKSNIDRNSTPDDYGKNKILKYVKIPVSQEFMKTSYSFGFEQEESLQSLRDLGTSALKEKIAGLKATKVVSQNIKSAINPNMENAFTGVDFRKLSFSFELIPKNKAQSVELDRIVHMFKYWSHPNSRSSAGFKILDYPSRWRIHYNDGTGNTSGVSFQTKPCFCDNITIEYGSTNGYLLFRETNRPTSIRFTLNFIENEYITREDFPTTNNGGEY